VAKWILYENNRSFLTLLHRNLVNGQVFNCGELRRDTPVQMIVKWVLDQAAVQPGDLIKFPDGDVVQVLPSQQARA
jgi:hypothetical protein